MARVQYPEGIKNSGWACKWIDDNMNDPNVDKDKLYEYLLCVSKIFTRKYGNFFTQEDEEEFSAYYAEHLFYRITQSKKPPLKRIVRFIEETIRPWKNNFLTRVVAKRDHEQEINDKFYSDIPLVWTDDANKENGYQIIDDSAVTAFNLRHFFWDLDDIYSNMEDVFNTSPMLRYFDKTTQTNLLISCCMTVLSSITAVSTEAEVKLHINQIQHTDTMLTKDDVILFHLPKRYFDYVYIISKKIKLSIFAELYHELVQMSDRRWIRCDNIESIR